MCFFSSPSMPGAPPPPAPPPASPTEVDPAVQAARDEQKRRTAEMRGYASTIAPTAGSETCWIGPGTIPKPASASKKN